jgi:predicted DNA-binding transcriptional regulator AlpA
MNPQAPAPLLDVKALCKLLGVSDEFVYAHVNTTDPDEYWEHHRVGRRIKFDSDETAAILAKCKQPGPAHNTPEPVSDAAIERGLRRLAPA